MTLAYIKSNTLRRALLVVSILLFPFVLLVLGLIKAADAFVEEVKDQTGGGDGIWDSVKGCWKGARS